MMIIVKFARVKEWQMIATMIVQCGDYYMQQPKQSCRHVTSHKLKANHNRNYVAENAVNFLRKLVIR